MKTVLPFVLSLAVVAALVCPVEAAGLTIQRVRGELASTEDGSSATGRFALTVVTSGDRGAGKLLVFAGGLDAGNVCEVVLGEDVDTGTPFGELEFRGSRGFATFRFSSLRDSWPEGVTSLADFSGQKLFVVSDGSPVLEGAIPDFVDPDGGDAEEGTFAVGAGLGALTPPADSGIDAVGAVSALAVNLFERARERLAFRVIGLDRGAEYAVWLTGDEETELGSFTARGFLGLGSLVLDTGRGDTLPGHLGGLAGAGLEVRDADGSVVLAGSIPRLR
ncbi:MAG: hypothetical protein MUE73_13570 [Planctomycetes bacterium]|nr:hypothetical protein [Planctomycetota bacterium]